MYTRASELSDEPPNCIVLARDPDIDSELCLVEHLDAIFISFMDLCHTDVSTSSTSHAVRNTRPCSRYVRTTSATFPIVLQTTRIPTPSGLTTSRTRTIQRRTDATSMAVTKHTAAAACLDNTRRPIVWACDFPGCPRTFKNEIGLQDHKHTHTADPKPHK